MTRWDSGRQSVATVSSSIGWSLQRALGSLQMGSGKPGIQNTHQLFNGRSEAGNFPSNSVEPTFAVAFSKCQVRYILGTYTRQRLV